MGNFHNLKTFGMALTSSDYCKIIFHTPDRNVDGFYNKVHVFSCLVYYSGKVDPIFSTVQVYIVRTSILEQTK